MYIHEVITDYTDDQRLTHIDVYESPDSDASGKTVAVVDRDTRKVIFFDNSYRLNDKVKEAIAEVLKEMEDTELEDELLDTVVDEIKRDLSEGDVSAIYGLLSVCSTSNLIQYLPEEKWPLFEKLR